MNAISPETRPLTDAFTAGMDTLHGFVAYAAKLNRLEHVRLFPEVETGGSLEAGMCSLYGLLKVNRFILSGGAGNMGSVTPNMAVILSDSKVGDTDVGLYIACAEVFVGAQAVQAVKTGGVLGSALQLTPDKYTLVRRAPNTDTTDHTLATGKFGAEEAHQRRTKLAAVLLNIAVEAMRAKGQAALNEEASR